jgi:hypothetical protein
VKKLSSKDLKIIQDLMISHIQTLLVEPDCDFKEVSDISKVIDKIDYNRRKKWNHEKFGPYEKMVDEMLNAIDPDDIPF